MEPEDFGVPVDTERAWLSHHPLSLALPRWGRAREREIPWQIKTTNLWEARL